MPIGSAETQIRSAIDEWTRAIGRKDPDAVATFFTRDLVTFDLAPPLKHSGFDRQALAGWFGTWQGDIDYDVTDLQLSVGSDLAVARSLDHMRGKKTDGEAVDLWTRSTVCFRKAADGWKVFHVHSSVPFHMDGSYKAAIDLKPEARS
jgi:PhnB protein